MTTSLPTSIFLTHRWKSAFVNIRYRLDKENRDQISFTLTLIFKNLNNYI